MPENSQRNEEFQESAQDKQVSPRDWRRVTFRLSNEVAFENIVADRWDSGAQKPAGLQDMLGRFSVPEDDVERLRKEPYTFSAPVSHIVAIGHYYDTHISESALQLSQLTLEEYKAECAKPDAMEWGLDHIIRLQSLRVSIEDGGDHSGAFIWRDRLDYESAAIYGGDLGEFHLRVIVDSKTMLALLQSLRTPDHRITLTLQLKGSYKSEDFWNRDLFFWLEDGTSQRDIYGEIELTNIRIGSHGGVSEEAWILPATSSIPQTQKELAEWKKQVKKYYRLEHLKKYWWAYLLAALFAQDAIRQLLSGLSWK